MTALGVLCCFALFVCLTLLASFFLPSHLSFKNMYIVVVVVVQLHVYCCCCCCSVTCILSVILLGVAHLLVLLRVQHFQKEMKTMHEASPDTLMQKAQHIKINPRKMKR